MAVARGLAAVRELQLPKFNNSRDDISGHAQTPEPLVSGGLVGHQPEDWCQCDGAAAGAGAKEL